jgi:hypothetical protein
VAVAMRMVDAFRVERGSAPRDAADFMTLFQEEFNRRLWLPRREANSHRSSHDAALG